MTPENGLRVTAEYLNETGDILRPAKLRSYALMGVSPGQRVLDVGCGPGTDTLPLSTITGSTGLVTGVDHDPAMVDEAETRAAAERLTSRVRHFHAEAYRLPFPSGTFDSCRSERLFQHLASPEIALSEMARVTKPGGRVVVLDTDWGSLSVATDEAEVERRLARVRAELLLRNGYSGRLLYRLFRQQRLDGIKVELYPCHLTDYRLARSAAIFGQTEEVARAVGAVTAEELRRWHASLEREAAEGTFFASLSLVLLRGVT